MCYNPWCIVLVNFTRKQKEEGKALKPRQVTLKRLIHPWHSRQEHPERVQLANTNIYIGAKSLHLLQNLIWDAVHNLCSALKGNLGFFMHNIRRLLKRFQSLNTSFLFVFESLTILFQLAPRHNHDL